MKKYVLAAVLSTAVFAIATPGFAKTETQVVGYVVTTTTVSDRDGKFHEIDENKDGAINFKEFQKHAILENEYEMFDMNDTDNDQLLSLEEYRNFSKEGPARDASGPILTQYNFNKKTVE